MSRLTGALCALIVAAVPASAADIVRREPAPYSPAYSTPYQGFNWSGFYVGLNAGYQSGTFSNSGLDPSGLNGGITGGANWQWGSIVFGTEMDVNFSGVEDGIASDKWKLDWFGTMRGRVGYAWDRFLPYITGGFAVGRGTYKTAAFSDENTHVGWTVGVGVEGAITNHVSAKIEYLYLDFGEKGYSTLPYRNGYDASLVRAGVNYRF